MVTAQRGTPPSPSPSSGNPPPTSPPLRFNPFERLAQVDQILEHTIRTTPEVSAALSQARATLVDFVGLCVVAAQEPEAAPAPSQRLAAALADDELYAGTMRGLWERENGIKPVAREQLRRAPIRGGAFEPEPDRKQMARAQGYTGEFCPECGGVKMIRSGTCSHCGDCGTTTGCS